MRNMNSKNSTFEFLGLQVGKKKKTILVNFDILKELLDEIDVKCMCRSNPSYKQD